MAVIFGIDDPLDERAEVGRGGDYRKPRVELLGEQGQTLRSAELTSTGITVGRAPGNTLVVDDEAIGRYHLRIDWDGSQATVTDLGTRSGTLIDREQLGPHAAQPWRPGAILQIGAYQLRLSRAGADTLRAPRAQSSSGVGRLALALESGKDSLDLIPGEPSLVTIILKNRSRTPDRLSLTAEGHGAAWVQPPAEVIELGPGGETSIPLRVLVPRTPESRAGEYLTTIRARSLVEPRESAALTSRWIVHSFAESALALRPHKRSARGMRHALYSLAVSNLGNATTYYDLRAGEDEPALEYELEQPRIVVEPGMQANLRLEVQARERPAGRTQTYNFSVKSIPANSPVQIDNAQFVNTAGLPPWLLPVALIALLLLLFGAAVLVQARKTTANDFPQTTSSLAGSTTSTDTTPAADTTPTVDASGTAVALQSFANLIAQTAAAQVLEQAKLDPQANIAAVQTAAAQAGQTAAAQVYQQATSQADQAAAAAASQTAIAELIKTTVAGSGSGGSGATSSPPAPTAPPATPAPTATPMPTATPTASPTSIPPTVVPPAGSRLVFQTQPTDVVAGGVFQVTVQLLDKDGNPVPRDNVQVSLSLKSSNGATLLPHDPLVQSTTAGVATFDALSIQRSGTAYHLTASAVGLKVDSDAFDVLADQPAQLRFSTQPSHTPAGVPLLTQPVVQVTDRYGNLATDFTGNVTLALNNNPSNANLTPTNPTVKVFSGTGTASFSGVQINKVGVGYTLQASSESLTSATSTPFNITANRLRFSIQPSNSTGGIPFPTQPRVQATDGFGNVDTTFVGDITLSLMGNSNGAQLGPPANVTVSASGGEATFSGLYVDKVGAGYSLRAIGSNLGLSLTPATSTPFSIAIGQVAQLQFSVQPSSSAIATKPFPIQPRVQALDAGGNLVNFNGLVTLAILNNPGGGTLNGTPTVLSIGGTAIFTDLSINKVGHGYTLLATNGTLASDVSNAFDVEPGPATHLAFHRSPDGGVAALPFPIQPQVWALDAGDNLASSFAGNVTLSLGANPGGGTLGPSTNLQVQAQGGIADFRDLRIDKVGVGYTLQAVSGTFSGISSTPFTIVAGAATHLVFSMQPTTTTATVPFTVVVEARDAGENRADGFTGTVTIAIQNNAGSPVRGTLSGTLTVQATGGLATFTDLSIDKVGNGYTLWATAGVLFVDSSSFGILAGSARELVFNTQPRTTQAGKLIGGPPQVYAVDAGGNHVTLFSDLVTVMLQANPTGATLTGTLTLLMTGGVATFGDLTITRAGVGYTLRATTASLNDAFSMPFNIDASSADHLVFNPEPANTLVNTPFTLSVEAHDKFDNVATSYSKTIKVRIKNGTGTSGAKLLGTTSMGTSGGVATFSLAIDTAGSGYTLTANDGGGGLSKIDSMPFDIFAAPLAAGTAPLVVEVVKSKASIDRFPGSVAVPSCVLQRPRRHRNMDTYRCATQIAQASAKVL